MRIKEEIQIMVIRSEGEVIAIDCEGIKRIVKNNMNKCLNNFQRM